MSRDPARSPSATPPQDSLWREIADFLRQFVIAAFDPYRPEQHYMRGPGPACAAKRAAPEGAPVPVALRALARR
jgi:hypothetical protein